MKIELKDLNSDGNVGIKRISILRQYKEENEESGIVGWELKR
jgi:hypothetical protein